MKSNERNPKKSGLYRRVENVENVENGIKAPLTDQAIPKLGTFEAE